MRTSIVLGAAALTVVGAGVAPSAVGAADTQSAPQITPIARQFMAIVCPADKWWKPVDKNWHKAYGKRKTVPDGTKVPKYLRNTYRKAAKAHLRAAQELTEVNWPATIAADVSVEVDYYTTAFEWLNSRNTKRVSPTWLPWSSVTNDKKAWKNINQVLNLPNSCKGFT